MTSGKSRFLELKSKSEGVVTFGDNSKSHIEVIGFIGKFDAKSDKAIFLGYSLSSKAYRVFNKRILVVEELIHVVFDDNLLSRKDSCDDDDVGTLEANDGGQSSKVDEVPYKEEAQDPPLETLKDMSLEQREVTYPREFNYVKSIQRAINDDYWILAMQDELNQFERSNVTTQEEGIDFDETYASVARMEAIKMLLAFACHQEFKLFQMDVKSVFLNGIINEEVFQASSRESHLKAIKRNFRYLGDTPNLGLWYLKDSSFDLHAYSMWNMDVEK
ncbi:hypothetical protein V6N13_059340 [Hibiscus sabdariffa]